MHDKLPLLTSLVLLCAISAGCGPKPPVGEPDSPQGLSASGGSSSTAVKVRWDDATGAKKYRIYRDNVFLVEVLGTSHDDTSATPGGLPSAPVAVSASAGTHGDHVAVTWSAPPRANGPVHRYRVTAVNDVGESPPSDAVEGFRGAYPVTYQVSLNEGADWADADAGGTRFEDFEAPEGSVVAGSIVASQGTSFDHVALEAVGAEITAGAERTYFVRTISLLGTSEPASATGFRGTGAISYEWERSAHDASGGFELLQVTTGPQAVDGTAPADGGGRYYRVRIVSGAAGSPTSDDARGFRASAPAVITGTTADLTGTSLVASGTLETQGVPPAAEVGFCVGISPQPVFGAPGVTCVELESPGVGGFTAPLSGLAGGTTYHLRAFARHPNLAVFYGADVVVPLMAPPTNVTASQGTSPALVTVTWDAVAGASAYRVFRDGSLAGEVNMPLFGDSGAGAGSAPSLPTGFAASQAVHTDRVELSWAPPQDDPGPTHTYSIVAVNAGGSTLPSAGATGFRGGFPVLDYELAFGAQGSTSVGLVSSAADFGAPAGVIQPGTASASQGASIHHVALLAQGHGVSTGAPRTYQLRAVNAAGPGQVAVSVGSRGVGSIAFQWRRSATDADANYLDLAGATSWTFLDTSAPSDGTGRYYQVEITADGALPAVTPPALGFRAVVPSVTTDGVASVTSAGFVGHGALIDAGVPPATAVGFCAGPAPAPALGQPGVVCPESGSTGAGPFTQAVFGLTGGTTWFVRALARHPSLGPSYGADLSVLTLPAPPVGVGASQGASPGHVTVSWSASTGADSYRVFRDGVLVAEAPGTGFDDFLAGAGDAPAAPPGLVASDGSLHDRVSVTWAPASAGAGTSHSYTVRAINASGESAPSQEGIGYRAPFPIDGYEWSIDGQSWTSLGNVLAADDYTADPGALQPGAASASKGTSQNYVSLVYAGGGTTPGPSRSYAVRAVNAMGTGPAATDTGYRGVGSESVQWERSQLDSDAAFDLLVGATAPTHLDTSAPVEGFGRYYRAVISAPGAAPVTTAADRGFRIATVSPVPRRELWATNGTVYAAVEHAGTLYVGGSFTGVHPVTGPFVAVDATTAAPLAGWPRFNGEVHAIESDGQGGWYVGGSFTGIDAEPRSGIARILGNGALDAQFAPDANDTVRALRLSSGVLYVGGDFTTIGGASRSRIAALDPSTGLATGWDPGANASVRALAAAGGRLFVGGDFTTLAGDLRTRLGAFDESTGAVVAGWNPVANGAVRTLVAASGIVYAGGEFTTLGGQSRNYLAAVDDASGAVLASWNPSANAVVNAFALGGTVLYLGGSFSTLGGISRSRVGAVNAISGAVTSWNPGATSIVHALAVNGSTIYMGGQFTSAGSQPRNRLAAVSTSGSLLAWNPDIGGPVTALAAAGGGVYVGGSFIFLGPIQQRNRLAAFDVATGAVTGWDPNANGTVRALAVQDGLMYAGGIFTNVGSQFRNRVAVLDLVVGGTAPWAPHANDEVYALTAGGGRIWVGGAFTTINGAPCARFAALNPMTNTAGCTGSSVNGPVHALAYAGSSIYLGGNFTQVYSAPRPYLAQVSTTTFQLNPWSPGSDGRVESLALANDTLYVGGLFSNVGGQQRPRIASFDVPSGQLSAWNPAVVGNVHALVATRGALYVGGIFTGAGGSGNRRSLAAFDLGTGALMEWDPGAQTSVRVLAAGPGGIYAGGEFTSIGRSPNRHLAAFGP